jgi:hypothetical protein
MADGAPEQAFEARERARWQRRLLPFLIGAISLMALFFFASSFYQLDRFGQAISYPPDQRIERSLADYEHGHAAVASRAGTAARADDFEYLRWKTLVQLEQDTLDHRYAQVNATLLLRAWTRHLGFLTGMILALVGAIFILAKLREEETRLSGEGAGAKAALATTSPGIVLATLGTVLMVVTLTVNFEFTTTDRPVYLGADGGTAPLPPPPPLADEAARQAEETSLFGSPAQEGQNVQMPPSH